jgi:hypothetical protein
MWWFIRDLLILIAFVLVSIALFVSVAEWIIR